MSIPKSVAKEANGKMCPRILKIPLTFDVTVSRICYSLLDKLVFRSLKC